VALRDLKAGRYFSKLPLKNKIVHTTPRQNKLNYYTMKQHNCLPAKEGVVERNGIPCQGLDAKWTEGSKQFAKKPISLWTIKAYGN
jgi:hypothetical protein